MDTSTLLDEFVSAILSRDGERFAKLFAPDGTYDDVFYGVHRGREDIAHMVNDRFYETADDFRWDMVNPVRQGDMIYSRVIFSYVSSLPGAMKPRVLMESVSMMAHPGIYRGRQQRALACRMRIAARTCGEDPEPPGPETAQQAGGATPSGVTGIAVG